MKPNAIAAGKLPIEPIGTPPPAGEFRWLLPVGHRTDQNNDEGDYEQGEYGSFFSSSAWSLDPQ